MTTRNQSLENKWTPEEDIVLTGAVASCGPKVCWGKVAAHLEGRTNKSCRKRWIHSLDPTLRKGRWTPAEDALLLASIENHGRHWYKVAKLLTGRTDDQCAKRWREKLDPSIRRDPWTEAEDNQLLDALDLHGKKWNLICGYLKGRPAVHCRNRWLSLSRSGRADNRNNNTLTRTSAIATLEAETCTIADTENCVFSVEPTLVTTPTFDLSTPSCRSSVGPPSPSTTSSLSPLGPLLSSWESGTRLSTLSDIMDNQEIKITNNNAVLDQALELDFSIFSPHSFLSSDQEDKNITSNSFSSTSDSPGTVPTTNKFLSSLIPRPPSTSDSETSGSDFLNQYASLIWDYHFTTSNGNHQQLDSRDSLGTSVTGQHTCGHSMTPLHPTSASSPSLSTDGSFRMTCPLPMCAFQSEKLTSIWRHITWEHVSGNNATSSKAMEELVERVVIGGENE